MYNDEGKEICYICGVVHEYSEPTNLNPNTIKCITEHKDWCDKIGGNIEHRFKKTYAEIYNVLEIALDGKKLEKVKDLIGDAIYDTKIDCLHHVAFYLSNLEYSKVDKDKLP